MAIGRNSMALLGHWLEPKSSHAASAYKCSRSVYLRWVLKNEPTIMNYVSKREPLYPSVTLQWKQPWNSFDRLQADQTVLRNPVLSRSNSIKESSMGHDGNFWGWPFLRYIHVESYFTPETNIMYQLYFKKTNFKVKLFHKPLNQAEAIGI